MNSLTISSTQWRDAFTPSPEMIDTISDIFTENCDIFLYSACHNIERESLPDSDNDSRDVHIGFYGCTCPNTFANNNTASGNASFCLKRSTIEFPITDVVNTDDSMSITTDTVAIDIDRGNYLTSALYVKARAVKPESVEEITVARITYPNTICILLRPGDIPINLLKFILMESKKYLYCSESEFKTLLRNAASDNLLRALRFPFRAEREKLIAEIERIKTSITDLENKVAEQEASLLVKQQQLTSVSKLCDDTGGITEIIAAIDSIEKISSVTSSSGCELLGEGIVKVNTNTIYVTCQKQRYLLGEYEITLNFLTHKVSFKNLVPELRRKSYWGEKCHHPHVSHDGSACLGNIKEDIKEALKAFDFQYAVLLAVSFLKNVNITDAAGKQIVHWPVVDEVGNILRDSSEELTRCHICGTLMPDNEENEAWDKCSICGHFTCPAHLNTVSTKHGDILACSYCSESHLKQCCECDEIELVDNMFPESSIDESGNIITTGRHLCTDCVNTIDICVPASPDVLAHKTIFVTNEFVNSHIKQCEICGENFATNDSEECQCPYCRSGGTYFTCPDCGAVTIGAQGVKLLRNGIEITVCADCSQHYVTCMQCLNSVRENEYVVISSVAELYMCNDCQNNLTEEEENVQHT